MLEMFLYSSVSLLVFLCCFYVQHKYKAPILNPLLMSIIVIIFCLWLLDMNYQDYMQGAQLINYLLEPAVVLLGYPLYKQIHLLRSQWWQILLICFLASICALTVCTLLASYLGLEVWLIASMVSMNITTAVAMSTSVELGGTGSITAVMVLLGGLSGSILGVFWLGFIGLVKKSPKNSKFVVTHTCEQKIIGMAIGSASHALGTASIAKPYPIAAAYSSTALILCAIFTALIAPVYVPFLLSL